MGLLHIFIMDHDGTQNSNSITGKFSVNSLNYIQFFSKHRLLE
jgi:hypothetical protein